MNTETTTKQKRNSKKNGKTTSPLQEAAAATAEQQQQAPELEVHAAPAKFAKPVTANRVAAVLRYGMRLVEAFDGGKLTELEGVLPAMLLVRQAAEKLASGRARTQRAPLAEGDRVSIKSSARKRYAALLNGWENDVLHVVNVSGGAVLAEYCADWDDASVARTRCVLKANDVQKCEES